MADDTESLSKRARTRAAALARREAKAALRQASFESVRRIAEGRKVSVKTVSREIERAVAERRLDATDRFVHLQVARLTKALRLADARIDRGELAAIAPLVKVVPLSIAIMDARTSPSPRGRRRARPRCRAAARPGLSRPPLDDIDEKTLEGRQFLAPKELKSLTPGQTCTGRRMAKWRNSECRNSEWRMAK